MKIPQRQEIWEAPYTKAYVVDVRYGFVMYIQKTGDIYKTLEMPEDNFADLFSFKSNSMHDVADLFKESDSEKV